MSASPILATRNLGLDIGGATIVADVELEVLDGELLAVIGPNGAGKTTLFNLVSGLRRPTSGSVELDGVDVTEQPPYRRAKAGLGRTFQVSNVFPLLSVHENVRLSAEAAIGGTMRIWRRATAVPDAVARATWAIARVGLADREWWPAGLLSHGDKRKLELAMLLAADPRVLLLDEPMAGVSMEDVPELVELIRSVHADEGKTVLMVEHHMEVVIGLAQRIAVMHDGALLAVDTPDGDHGERDGAAGLPRGGALVPPLVSVQRSARLPRRVACPAGDLVRRPGRRRHGAARPQRRRQDHDPARPHRARRAPRHGRAGGGGHHGACARTGSSAAASATSPRIATSSRRSPSTRTCAWPSGTPSRGTTSSTTCSRSCATRGQAGGGNALGRAAADARDRPRAPERQPPAAGRRAHEGPVAAARHRGRARARARLGAHDRLLVEQNLGVVQRVARDAVVLDTGRVVHVGPARELLDDKPAIHRMLGVG